MTLPFRNVSLTSVGTSSLGTCCTEKKVTLRVLRLRVSSKVRIISPASMSMSKACKYGGVVSSVKLETCSVTPFGMGTTLFPFMSTSRSAVKEMKVLLIEVAIMVRFLI